MLETVITMMSDDRLAGPAADGTPRVEVIGRLADDGFALTRAIQSAMGTTEVGQSDGGQPNTGEVRVRFRAALDAFCAAARDLETMDADTSIEYRAMTLRPAEVVPQRIAEVVLAHDNLDSVWTIEEADPDSVLDALEAMIRRIDQHDDIPPLTLATLEGEVWQLNGGGSRVHGTREALAQWLARGVEDHLQIDGEVPTLPQWA
jgi:maleylpyruvate isomerase